DLQPAVRRLIPADEDTRDGRITTEPAPSWPVIEHVDHHHGTDAEDDGQDEPRKNDEEGEVLGPDTRLHQTNLGLFDLIVLKHFELREELPNVVGRLVAVRQLLALVSGR